MSSNDGYNDMVALLFLVAMYQVPADTHTVMSGYCSALSQNSAGIRLSTYDLVISEDVNITMSAVIVSDNITMCPI